MPSAQLNGNTSHRRSLSSKSLNKSTTVLTTRIPSHPKLSSLGKKRTIEVELTGITGSDEVTSSSKESEDLDMTFLQYCTTCDKQILAPNGRTLYCSESCRRKDSLSATTPPLELKLTKRTSLHISPVSSFSTMSFAGVPFEESPSEESSRLPPSISPTTLDESGTKPPHLHDHKPDLDPTEWKPNSTSTTENKIPVSASTPLSFVIPNLLTEEEIFKQDETGTNAGETTVQNPSDLSRPSLGPKRQSAAFTYLSQFHRSASSFISLTTGKRAASSRTSSRTPSRDTSRNNSSISIPQLARPMTATSSAPSLGLSSRNTSSGSLSGISSAVSSTSGSGCEISMATSEDGQGLVVVTGHAGGKAKGEEDAEGRLRGLLAKA